MAENNLIARVIRAGKSPLRCCTSECQCFYCEQAITAGEFYRDEGDGSNRIHDRCHVRAYQDLPQTVDHEFFAQSVGSAYCRCGLIFDAPPHNYRHPDSTLRESSQSIAEDLLEYMEYDIAEDRQLRAEEFS